MLKIGPKFITGCVVSMLVMNAVGLGATLARQGLTGASFGAVAGFLFENGVLLVVYWLVQRTGPAVKVYYWWTLGAFGVATILTAVDLGLRLAWGNRPRDSADQFHGSGAENMVSLS